MEILERVSGLRTLECEGKELKRIVVHNGEEELLTVQRGWLEHYDLDHLDNGYSTSFDTDTLTLDSVRLARKVKLEKKDNFIIKFKDSDRGFLDEGYSLYIYAQPTFIRTLESKSETSVSKVDIYRLPLKCSVLRYVENPDKNADHPFARQSMPQDHIILKANHRSERTPYGERCEDLASKFAEILPRGGVYASDVARLLEVFSIEER